MESPTTLPHSALNTHIGADANLGLLLLANGYDYFNFPGLIDAYLWEEDDGPMLSVLYTGELSNSIAEDLADHSIVSESGIQEATFFTNPDYAEHFQQLIDDRPDYIKPSIVERMNVMLEDMKSTTPNQAQAKQEALLAEAAEASFGGNKNVIINPSDNIVPLSGKRETNTIIPGTLPESATEGLKEHLRQETGTIIKP